MPAVSVQPDRDLQQCAELQFSCLCLGKTGQVILTQWCRGGMDWIRLAQDGDQWRALVNMIMNLCHKNDRKFLSS
jgi:hypothetical protein